MKFEFHNPTHLIFGAGTLSQLGEVVSKHGKKALIVTGLVQRWGDPVQEIRKGDVVWIPPQQKHWHGASSDSPMAHIAIVEQHDSPSTQWLEKVSDEQYGVTSE